MISVIKKLLHNKILFFLFLAFIIVNVVDIITAYFILPGESNPIFLFTNTIWALFAFKVIILSALGYYIYRNIYPTTFTYYIIILIVVFGILTVGIATYANIQGIKQFKENPKLIEEVSKLSKEEKSSSFWNFALGVYYIPITICLLTFWLYEKSQKYIIVNKKYFDSKPWWKRW